MRIGIAHWSRRLAGGAESYLATLLPALDEAGEQVGLLSETEGPADRPTITGAGGVVEWPVATLGREGALTALGGWHPDVIYSHGLLDPGFEAELLTLAPACTFVHSYYGCCISGGKTFKAPTVRPCHRRFGAVCLALYYPRRCGGLSPATMMRDYARQRARRRLLERYDGLLTASQHMRRELLRQGLPEDRVHRVELPVPPAPLAADEPRTLPDDGPLRLLWLGRLDPLKGGATLLAALPLARATLGRPLRLDVAGDGPQRRWLEGGAAALGGSGIAAELHGWVDEDARQALLDAAHLLVVPSLWPEPFGLVGPEAGRHGLPAAAFDVGGISDWLEDGVNGHLAASPPTPSGLAGAIARCLRDREHYRRLSRHAAERAARFTLQRHLERLLPILRAAAETRRAL